MAKLKKSGFGLAIQPRCTWGHIRTWSRICWLITYMVYVYLATSHTHGSMTVLSIHSIIYLLS